MMLDVGTAAEVAKRKRVVVAYDDRSILVLANEGGFHAFENICIHRQRELSKGMVFKGKLVCPGHQWAFDLDTGFESVKGECQPMYDVSVVDGHVMVDTDSRCVRVEPTAGRAVETADAGDAIA